MVWRYVVRRLLWAILTVILVLALVFALFFVVPGSLGNTGKGKRFPPVAYIIAGRRPTKATLEAIVHRLGLNEPVYMQFARYVEHTFTGNLGYSYQTNESISKTLMRRFPATLSLAVGASIIWLLIGCAIGALSALRRGSLADRSAMIAALIGISIPIFFLGLVAVFLFDGTWGVYNTGDYVGITQNPLRWLSSMWLPWLVLASTYAAIYSRVTRGNMLEVMSEDYVRTARAKGLSETRVVVRHILRSALTPVLTMYGMDVAILIGGAIITESIFDIPGIGAWVVQAIPTGDLPVILAVTLVASLAIVLLNLIVDIAYAGLDPRIQYS